MAEAGVEGATEEVAASANGGTAPSSDYLGRIREGGDFATEEIRKHQSRADQLEAKYGQIVSRLGGEEGALRQWLESDQVTAGQIESVVKNYLALRTSPQTQEIIQSLEATGEVPSRSAATADDDDEEFLTTEQKELRALRAEVAELRQGMGGLTASTGEKAVQDHLSRFRREWHLTDDELSKVAERIEKNVKAWKQNPQGQQLLRDIHDPSKYDEVIEPIALKHLKDVAPKAIRELSERERLRQRQQVAPFATDGPSRRTTTGHEPPSDISTWPAEKILAYAKEHPEMLPPE